MSQQITFLGAARTVTGSRHFIEAAGKKFLVDCGMFQGSRELKQRNWLPFEFDPADLDALVVTHAHLDHIGLIPKLVREGFQGPIYATPATCDLARISLPDSGRIQEEDARHHNKYGTRHSPALPLYTEKDAWNCLKNWKEVHPYQTQELAPDLCWQFLPAGHILGSAYAQITLPNGEILLMSGDLGRYGTPLIKDPTEVHFADYLVVESTYGDRLHPKEDTKAKLKTLINEALDNQSVIVVPSFSIGRTQEMLFYIFELEQEGEIDSIPIFVDSPMAASVTKQYDENREELDKEAISLLEKGLDPMAPAQLRFVRDSSESKALNDREGPMMIIAGSGMANAGRVVFHLMRRLPDRSAVVLFTGYQAEGTMGRRLLEGAEQVQIYGQMVPVRAKIEKLNALSAHADQGEIMKWLQGFKSPPKTTFIVHGEPKAQEALKSRIVSELRWDAVIPGHGDSFTL